MKKFLIPFLFLASLAWGQGGAYTSQVIAKGNQGFLVPVSGPSIKVCTDQACTSPISLFTSEALSIGTANPTGGDSQGNYTFYAAPGAYWCQITAPGYGTATSKCDVSIPALAILANPPNNAPQSINGSVSIGKLNNVIHLNTADGFSGSDWGAKIANALTSATGCNGVACVVDATNSGAAPNLSAFTVGQGQEVILPCRADITLSGTITVHEGSLHSNCTPNFNAGIKISAAVGFTGDMVQAVSSAGASDWWHWGNISGLRLQGNSTAASGLRVVNAGETSHVHEIVAEGFTNGAGFWFDGDGASGAGIENLDSLHNKYGYEFKTALSSFSMAEVYYIKGISLDDNTAAGIFLSAPAFGSWTFAGVKAEINTPATQNPLFLIDSATSVPQINIFGGASENLTGTNLVSITGAAGSNVALRIDGFKNANYTNLVNDAVNSVVVPGTDTTSNIQNFSYSGDQQARNYTNQSPLLANGTCITAKDFTGNIRSIVCPTTASDILLRTFHTGATTGWRFQDSGNTQVGAINAQGLSEMRLFVADQGTACTNGELALSAGWGSTAAVSAVVGQGQTCQWTITSSGTGQAANPTITDTLTNALPSASVVCDMRMVGGTGTSTLINQTNLSSTAPVFTFGGTPVAASTYFVVRRCGP